MADMFGDEPYTDGAVLEYRYNTQGRRMWGRKIPTIEDAAEEGSGCLRSRTGVLGGAPCTYYA